MIMSKLNSKMPAYEGSKGVLDSTIEKFKKVVRFDERETALGRKPVPYMPLNYYGTFDNWKKRCVTKGLTVKKVSPSNAVDPHYHALKNGKPVGHYNTFLRAGFFA